MTQTTHEIVIQTISHIQTETVDIKFIDPALYTFQKIIYNSRIGKVQFDQFKMSFPSLIPESVLITTVTVKIDVEPVFGFLKANLRFNRFTVRGEFKAKIEMGLALMAVNLRKYMQHTAAA